MYKLTIAIMLLIAGCNQVSGAADITFIDKKVDTETETDTVDGGIETDTSADTEAKN
jgi:hypothetical protein